MVTPSLYNDFNIISAIFGPLFFAPFHRRHRHSAGERVAVVYITLGDGAPC